MIPPVPNELTPARRGLPTRAGHGSGAPPAAGPGCRPAAGQGGRPQVRVRRERARPDAEQRLQQPGGRGGECVPEEALRRADHQRVRAARLGVDLGGGGDLHPVADPRPGPVGLQVVDGGRVEIDLLERLPHRADLPVGVRCDQRPGVVGAAHGAQHAVDPVAVADGVRQPFEQEQRAAVAGAEPVGGGVEVIRVCDSRPRAEQRTRSRGLHASSAPLTSTKSACPDRSAPSAMSSAASDDAQAASTATGTVTAGTRCDQRGDAA